MPSGPWRTTAPTDGGPRTGAAAVVVGLVALVAVAARWALLARVGGPYGASRIYDAGVYLAAAQSFSFGRLPYRDFVLLHPPAIVWALTPFAFLGRLTGDANAVAWAKIAWTLLGGLNAGLVAFVARRSGLLTAAIAGGVYAVLPPAVYGETAPMLEPLATLALLVALAVLVGERVRDDARLQVVVGVAAGLLPTVKIWGAVTTVIVLVAVGLRLGRRPAVRALLAAVASAAVVCLPFFVAAPGAMWRMVVLDQLGRGHSQGDLAARLQSLLGFGQLLRDNGQGRLSAPGVVGCVVLAVLVVLAWWGRDGRLFVALAVAHLAVLLAAPSYFLHYGSWIAAPLALVTAAGLGVLLKAVGRPPALSWLAAGTVAAAALAVSAVWVVDGTRIGKGLPFPAADLSPGLASSRCVTSDDPELLSLLGVMSRNLQRGCPLPVDLTGLTYGRDALPLLPDGSAVPRPDDPRWQHDLMTYLTSGRATILDRTTADGFSTANRRVVRSWSVVAHSGTWRVLEPRVSGTR